LLQDKVEGMAISFINSYANPINEARARDLIENHHQELSSARLPSLSLSSDISRERREYERTNTRVLNAYVMPLMDVYLHRLTRDFRELGMNGTLYMMLSGSGVASFEYAAKHPIETVESGPAAGAVGAIAVTERIGAHSIVAMGGGSTTTKASLIHDLQMRFTSDYAVERDEHRPGYPIKVPVMDISEIGIGGGSIAWLDEVGDLKVGPLDAAADPGPACYGLGATQPTLTYAYLVAGFLDPTPQYLAATRHGAAATRPSERMVYWSKEDRVATVVLRRDQLPPQAYLTGPAIIEEPTTTMLIPSAFSAEVDDLGNLILERT
jgi:N-methylhydantoinase A